jgi:hypothetical protein
VFAKQKKNELFRHYYSHTHTCIPSLASYLFLVKTKIHTWGFNLRQRQRETFVIARKPWSRPVATSWPPKPRRSRASQRLPRVCDIEKESEGGREGGRERASERGREGERERARAREKFIYNQEVTEGW